MAPAAGIRPGIHSAGRGPDDLILIAYHVEMFQISSKLPLDRDEFDLTARVPAGATRDEFRAMLRNLLAERFHMKLHVESREFPGFGMTIAKGGTKLGGPIQNGHVESFNGKFRDECLNAKLLPESGRRQAQDRTMAGAIELGEAAKQPGLPNAGGISKGMPGAHQQDR